MRAADLICLFHALAGMCLGWMAGFRTNALHGVSFAVLGLLAGLLTGFLLGRLPKSVPLVFGNLSQKYRLFAVGFSVIAVLAGVLFWWTCLNSVTG